MLGVDLLDLVVAVAGVDVGAPDPAAASRMMKARAYRVRRRQRCLRFCSFLREERNWA